MRSLMRLWCLLGAVFTPAAPAAAHSHPPAGLASGSPRLLRADISAQFRLRPATITFGAGADLIIAGPHVTTAEFRARHWGRIHWTRWDFVRASGNGLLWINTCIPNCARGTYHPHTIHLSAYRVRAGRYTRLQLDYRDGRRRVHRIASLGHIGGQTYDWV